MVRSALPGAEVFYDVMIRAGEDFSDTLARRLEEAEVVLFRLSPDWLQSSNCKQEMQAALAQPDKRLIPIILKPCDWFSTPLARFMALPRDTKPVSTWKNRDEAFADIANGNPGQCSGRSKRRMRTRQRRSRRVTRHRCDASWSIRRRRVRSPHRRTAARSRPGSRYDARDGNPGA